MPLYCHDTRCKAYLNGYCGTTNPTPDTLKVVSNSNNPEESVGITYNQAMYSIMPNYAYGQLQPTDANVYAYTKAFLISQHYDSTVINNTNNYIISSYGSYSQIPSINTQASTLYNNHTITLEAKNYLNTLSSKIAAFCGSADSVAPSQASYNSFANSLVTYENQIKSSTTLTANDKYILDCAYSIARYSSAYTANYEILNNTYSSGSGLQSLNSMHTSLKSSKGWLSGSEVVGWDVAGGIGGAAGAVVGGFLSGGLTWALVGTAAATGAVAGSVSDFAYQIWNHFVN